MQAHRGRYLPPAEPPRRATPSTWIIGGAAIVVWAYFFVFLLPGFAS